MDYIKKAEEVIQTEIKGLEKVKGSLNEGFTKSVDLILESLNNNRKIVVTGIGKNLHIGEKISATLASTGATSVFLNPTQALHGDLGILNEGDVILALSYSGESEELIKIIPNAKRLKVKVVAMTDSADNSLAKCCDEVIIVAVDNEACPFNMAPTTSTTATLAVGDALAMVLLEAQGFRKEDYAKYHPDGAIGRTLLLHVSDIMRTGERVAVVHDDAIVKDALLAMTAARAGSAAVINGKDIVLGVFTDGDLRRQISDNSNLLDTPVKDVMTKDPWTLKPDQLAIDVLGIFEEHNIDDILVVDDSNKLVGAVDIQDLPKLKIL